MRSRRALKVAIIVLIAVAAGLLTPRAVHAYRVHEAKVWCEELARQIRAKHGDQAPAGEGPWQAYPPREFESTMPHPPALIGDFRGVRYRSWDEGFEVEFWWDPSPWTDSPWDPHNYPGCSVGWSLDASSGEWSKVGYFGPS